MKEQKNDCLVFIDSLIQLAQKYNHWTHGPDLHQCMRVGAALADRYIPKGHPARLILGSLISGEDLVPLPGVEGFKAELIAGGQGQEAYRHIAGAAAAVLERLSALVDLQNREDRKQFDSDSSSERLAELADNEAGRQVGKTLKAFLHEKMSEDTLRQQLTDILCEK